MASVARSQLGRFDRESQIGGRYVCDVARGEPAYRWYVYGHDIERQIMQENIQRFLGYNAGSFETKTPEVRGPLGRYCDMLN